MLIRTTRLLPLFAVLAAAGCATVGPPAMLSYRGQPVPAVNAMTMSCLEPYPFTQNCSAQGASLRVRINNVVVRVAGSTDGRIVMVVTEAAIPTQARAEEAADAAGVLLASSGARLLKMEALGSLGGVVPGYILHFDRDVYGLLRTQAVPL